jgi:hypothetical protein
MKRLILFVALFICCTLATPPIFAETITFDDFGPTYSGPVGDPFIIHGVTFTDFFLGYDQIDNNYLAVDFGYGEPGSDMASINFANPVYLTGFDYFTTGVRCLLNYGGTLISGGSSNLAESALWSSFNGGRVLIDEIVFQLSTDPPSNMASLTLDNLDYDPVPIPGALALLASGLLSIAGFRKKYMK